MQTHQTRQAEACGRCHARRGVVTDGYEYGKPLLDTHRVSLLEDRLYFADGQIDDEVYVYGSFVQSKMYRAGVTCSDCHDPHSTKLKSGPQASEICSTCHLPAKFASEEHHRHPGNSASCVDCHMATRDYMVVDGRRDHSFRIPRPDLTDETGAPNACSGCHDDRDAGWAAAAAERWYGKPAPHFASAIHAGRTAAYDANAMLLDAIADQSVSGIARASALQLLRAPFGRAEMEAVKKQIADPDPLVRMGAANAAAGLPAELLVQWLPALLDDPVRSVRLAAFRTMSPTRAALPASILADFDRVEREYFDAQLAIAERAEAHGNLGNLFVERGELNKAEASFRRGLKKNPNYVAIRVNLADLYRQTGRDSDAEQLLREGLEIDEDAAALNFSLGLLLVRDERQAEALSEIRKASISDPDNSRYAYVHAVALNSMAQPEQALLVATAAHERFAADFDIASLQVSILRDLGRMDEARVEAANLLQQFPENEAAKAVAASLSADR